MVTPRRGIPDHRRLAVVAVAVIDFSVVAWGVLAVADPEVLTSGFETYTGEQWGRFAGRAAAAEFLLIAFRLMGALNVAVGLILLIVATTGFRMGHRWAWWTLLIGNTLAIGAPIVYDRTVGFIRVFEVLEYVALAVVYGALAATRVDGSEMPRFAGLSLDPKPSTRRRCGANPVHIVMMVLPWECPSPTCSMASDASPSG